MNPATVSAAGNAQAAQTGLVTALGYDLERSWNSLDVSSLRQSLPGFKTLIASLVHRYGLASGSLASQFYRSQRTAAGVTSPFTVRPAPLPNLTQIGATVDWATQPLWSAQPDVPLAQTQLAGAVDTLVLDVGRQTIVDNTHRDRHAKGWARIPEPGACYFCALLASRGAVYKQNTVDFRAHNHCRCHAEPVFTAYEPSAQIREWQALYEDKVAGGRDLLKTWRHVYDATYGTPAGTGPNAPGGPT